MTLTLARTGGVYLLVRNSLTTVLTKNFMRTARAKGLKETRVKYIHALGNDLLPLIGNKGSQFFLEMAKECGYLDVQQIPLPEHENWVEIQ